MIGSAVDLDELVQNLYWSAQARLALQPFLFQKMKNLP